MTWLADCHKHAPRAAEARRRIAVAAASSTADAGASRVPAIFAGARAYLWLVAGMHREASDRFINTLCCEFGSAAVTSAMVEMCSMQPPGPKAWLRRECERRARTSTPHANPSLKD